MWNLWEQNSQPETSTARRMGIIGENSYEWFNCFLSIVCGGNIAVPFDKGLTAEELAQCVERSDIKALFYDDKHRELVAKIKQQCSQELELFRITARKTTWTR